MKKVFLIIAVATLSGCATQTFTMGPTGSDQPTEETMQNFFVSGIGQEKTIDAATVCGGADKVAKVETITRPLDGVLGFVTAGIYTPRTAKVYCSN